jgi:hypothetical protein
MQAVPRPSSIVHRTRRGPPLWRAVDGMKKLTRARHPGAMGAGVHDGITSPSRWNTAVYPSRPLETARASLPIESGKRSERLTERRSVEAFAAWAPGDRVDIDHVAAKPLDRGRDRAHPRGHRRHLRRRRGRQWRRAWLLEAAQIPPRSRAAMVRSKGVSARRARRQRPGPEPHRPDAWSRVVGRSRRLRRSSPSGRPLRYRQASWRPARLRHEHELDPGLGF